MNILNYLKSLLPVIGKDTIVENLRVTRGILSSANGTMATYIPLFRKYKFNDVNVNSLSRVYMTAMRVDLGMNNVASHFPAAIPNMMANIELIESLVEGTLEDSVATQNITYKKASLIRLCDAVDFATNYGITLMNFIVLREANAALLEKNPEAELQEDLPQPVVEKIMKNIVPFATVMAIFSRPVDDIRKTLESIPEVLVEDNNYAALSRAMGKASVDPLNLHDQRSFNGNPFQAIGRWRAERANAQYRLAQETIQQLKNRKIQLEQALAGKQDAAIERQIRATQSRIDELAHLIEKYENAH